MKRVCALDVVNAYKATGLIPIRMAWTSNDARGGCAIDALANCYHGVSGEEWAAENLDSVYIKGFLDAWDAPEPSAVLEEKNAKPYLIGYWDAILCREAVEREFSSITEVDAS